MARLIIQILDTLLFNSTLNIATQSPQKKPHIAVRLGITGGEYEIRTRHLLPARQAL